MSRAHVSEVEAPELPETTDQKQRRFVYSGEPGGGQSEFLTRGNKPLKRRRKSPFKIVSLVTVISLLIIFYVWNKITVNRLADEVDALQVKLGKIESINKEHRAEIGKRSNLDTITKIAKDKLGMVEAPDQKIYFEVENYEPGPDEINQ